MNAQHTLAAPLRFAGAGLHTGVEAVARVTPAEPGTGIVFVLDGGRVDVAADAANVTETRRATVLGKDGASVSTVEHLLSALVALGVDNARVEVEGPEIPILDGCATTFAEAIEATGLAAQGRERRRFTVDRAQVFRDGDAMLVVAPADAFRVRFAVDFAPPVGAQFLDVEIEPQTYVREIAPARTFGYLHEVEALRAAGLARGGTLDNALVFGPDGPLRPQRWPNEVVRHKILDLVGDLGLLGAAPALEIVSVKSGHRLHAQAARELRARFGAPEKGATS